MTFAAIDIRAHSNLTSIEESAKDLLQSCGGFETADR